MFPSFNRKIWLPAPLLTAIALFAIFFVYVPFSDALDASLLKSWFMFRGPRPVPQSVVVVKVDTRSYYRLGLSRSESVLAYLAEAMEKVHAAGAKMIVLDYFFDSKPRDAEELDRFQNAISNTPTVIGQFAQWYVDTDLEGTQRVSVERQRPLVDYAKSAKDVIQLMVTSTNGIVARISLADDNHYAWLERSPILRPLRKLVNPNIEEPSDYDLINFYGTPSGIADVPLYRVVSDEEPVSPSFFKDKVVFIGGVDFPGGKDGKDDTFVVSASNQLMWGVQILATITANLLDGSRIRRMDSVLEEKLMTVALVLLIVAVFHLGLYKGFLLTLAATSAWLVTSYYAFSRWFVFVPGAWIFLIVLPLLLGGMAIFEAIKWRHRFIGGAV